MSPFSGSNFPKGGRWNEKKKRNEKKKKCDKKYTKKNFFTFFVWTPFSLSVLSIGLSIYVSVSLSINPFLRTHATMTNLCMEIFISLIAKKYNQIL